MLSDAEIKGMLAFIRATWPPQIQEIQAARMADELTKQGRFRGKSR